MLQWEQEFRHEVSLGSSESTDPELVSFSEVLVIIWPSGEILRMPSGSCARDVVEQLGGSATTVFVNGNISGLGTVLKDGDMVEIRP